MSIRKSLAWLFVFIFLFTGPVSTAISAPDTTWEPVAAGIEYTHITLPDPNSVFVTRMDRDNESVIIDSSLGQGKLVWGRETVSGMFARYDQALNSWKVPTSSKYWGMRNQVVVAINGGYFSIDEARPQGGQIYSGWYTKRFDDLGGWSGFAWKLDRTAFIGRCVDNQPAKQFITYSSGITDTISTINVPAVGVDALVLYTSQYDSRTRTPGDNYRVEVLVEMTRPTLILPKPNYAVGIVRQVHENEGNILIPFNSIVLSATGAPAQKLKQNALPETEIRISQEITSYEYNCSTPAPSIDWTKTYASLQGAFPFLQNGQIVDFNYDAGATEQLPRTAIAYNDRYVFFIVVDGRDLRYSRGMTIHELAEFSLNTLSATNAIAEDGGGSSTMVVNGRVVNNTFCNNYTCDNYVFMPITIQGSSGAQSVPPADTDLASLPDADERPVANGMLMVVVQPAQYSYNFIPGNPAITNASVDLRLGPGTNYASFSTIPAASTVTILHQMNDLEGVQAKGTYWWFVDYTGTTGWLPEWALSHP